MNKVPFKFLDSYTLNDKEIFFGREKEAEEVYSRLFYSKLLLIYGPSGSGKTSLLQCGVANRFGEQNWKPFFIRRKQHILQSIHAELDKQAITPFKKEKTVTEKLYSLYLDFLTPVYLVFDQFEELFIFGDADEKREFVAVLKEILSHADINTQVVLSIREEYLASLSEFEDELPRLFENRIRVEKMKKAQALDVIVSPCEVCNVILEKGLAETAVEKIINESATIELTWLQVLMDRLYKSALARNEEKVEIKLSDLESLGNIGDVLGNFLEEQLQKMPDSKNGEAVLKSMISTEGTKRQLTLPEMKEALIANGHKLEEEEIQQIVQHFVKVRILSDKDENDRYELKHDSLAAKIFERLTLAERELQEVRQFVENAYKSYLKTEHLLGIKELLYVIKYEDKLFLNNQTEKFIKDSRQVLRHRRKMERQIRIISIISFVVLFSTFGFWAGKEVNESYLFKDSLNALLRKDDDPEKSLRLAIESYEEYNSPFASKALFESFYVLWNKDSIADSTGKYYSPYRKIFNFKPCKSDILFAEYSKDGKYLFGYLADHTIMIWSESGEELNSFKISDKSPLQLRISPDNNLLTCFYSDSTACLFTKPGKVLLETKIYYDLINPTRVMAFSADSKRVAYSIPGNKVMIYNTDGTPLQELGNHTKEVTAVDFSDDGKFLATASKDHTIIIYSFNYKKNFYDVLTIIKGHKDVVWSVEFASNSKYVLSASNDSTVAIWDYNSENVFKGSFEVLNKYVFDKKHKAKYTDARFSPKEDFISFKQYYLPAPDSSNIFWVHLSLNSNSYLPDLGDVYPRVIQFSSSGIIYQTSSGEIKFLSPKNRKFYSFKDNFSMFSVNDSYMIGIKKNILKSYPVSEAEIIRLVRKSKIFGNIFKIKRSFPNPLYKF
jgi:WD40 repeat protein